MPATVMGRVLRRVPERASGLDRAALRRYLRDYYAHVSREDLEERNPANLLGAALAHLSLARSWTSGHRRVRVYNPGAAADGFVSTHTIVQIVTADRPFLVDSITMALNRLGFIVHLIVHPVLYVRRGKRGEPLSAAADSGGKRSGGYESFMHVEVDRETDSARLETLGATLDHALENVRVAVEDWQAMLTALREAADGLSRSPPPLPPDEVTEASAFLDWLIDENFTFLGYREYQVVTQRRRPALRVVPGSGLGILRGPRMPDGSEPPREQPMLGQEGPEPTLIICTKSSFPSSVHRPGYMDRISLFRFDADGNVIGEHRILGLYTSDAYLTNPRQVPLLRRKIEWVRNRSGIARASHAGKSLLNILDTYPREELFQASPTELFETATGVLQLQERQRVRLFMRRDPFGRYLAGLVFVPRDRLDSSVRRRIEARLMTACHGTSFYHSISLTEAPLARLYFVVHTEPGTAELPAVRALEQELERAARSWTDALHRELLARFDEEGANDLLGRYASAFPAGYQEEHGPGEAVDDIVQLEAAALSGRLTTRLQAAPAAASGANGQASGGLNLKLFHAGGALPLSTVVPMLENLGVLVWSESPYEVSPVERPVLWLHDFLLRTPADVPVDLPELDERFREAVREVWNETLENDELNQLVLRAGLSAAQVVVVRCYTKYIRQIGGPFGQRYMAQTLAQHPQITRALVTLFETRFEPGLERRADHMRELDARIADALDAVASLDEDRILRRYYGLIGATLRTNYFQRDSDGNRKPYLSIKLDPHGIEGLPAPRPRFEIFVYAPRVEGVHLRGGEVARGGLRWSDRREDFRTEVLGLMKAQMVKNSVIVPVGAKGGFFVKRPPADGSREALRAEGIACYQTFIRGLLDLTDNRIAGTVVPPAAVVRYDRDDPYLVVAADKGTATFSDIANAVSAEYGFWLDDAFASGGSNGYDHKAMAITARGAWESVRHHFQRLGTNVQDTPFTVVGIGDMSGDVFGNGMLLSASIKLVAAFDHRHVFVDPNPDPAESFAERERLARLPGSSWADYDRARLSAGGEVFPRSAKSVRLSAAARKALGVKAERLTTDALIQAVLKAPVDLFWNGGIGTYVKASAEDHASVGDRANDAVRINSRELRCRVIGEGGNLGITQEGRVQFAGRGGHINADWIDNSGGVHCSDLEVNIKIFLTELVREGKLRRSARDRLLARMSDQIAKRVLRSNYRQARAVTLAEAESTAHLARYARLIEALEGTAGLDREQERLPDARGLERRASQGRGLRRPELAVLLAYTKNLLYGVVLESSLPDDPYLQGLLERYFPDPLRRHRATMQRHQLRAEIVSTVIANSIVNRAGPTFAHQLAADTGRSLAQVTRAYLVARDALDLPALWDAIDALDYQVDYGVQASLDARTQTVLERATRWLLRHRSDADLGSTVKRVAAARARLDSSLKRLLPAPERLRLGADVEHWCRAGVPRALAERVTRLPYLLAACNLQGVLAKGRWKLETAAGVYFHLGERLRLVRLQHLIESLPFTNRWQDRARVGAGQELAELQAFATETVLRGGSGEDPEAALDHWLGAREAAYAHYLRAIPDVPADEPTELAMLTVTIAELRGLLGAAAEVVSNQPDAAA